jgi:ATP-binding protein involved in chromosome partitioning
MNSDEMKQNFVRAKQLEEKVAETSKRIKHKIAVLSGKGGVGKSTVAVNLAVSLAEEGFNVGILDIDVHGPDVARMMGKPIEPVGTDGDNIVPAKMAPNLKMLSLALLVDDGKPIAWRGPLKHSAISQFIGDTEWGELDFLVIDMPPGTGDEALSIFQLLGKIDGTVIVTTPQVVAVDDVKRAISFVKSMKQEVIGVVENMSYVKCPECGKIIDIFGAGGGEKISKEMGIPLLGKLPLTPRVGELADQGKPFVSYARGSEIEKLFREITGKILDIMKI